MKNYNNKDPMWDKVLYQVLGNAYVIMSLSLPRIWEFVSDFHAWYNLITAILVLLWLQLKE